ncbi:MAG: signal recognition particle subunit [Vezdaea aestivalis]|nr:MAG: signal recognition particle subunit [Vezdaea aestivalis]
MAHQARIEEVSDSDSDPPDMDPSDFDPAEIMRRVEPSQSNKPAFTLPSAPSASSSRQRVARDPASYKHYQCLYPIYFDALRSRAEGRRVGKDLAVKNPLAHTVAMAVRTLGIQCEFEPEKCHPKDWANPGRVKALVKKDGKGVDARVKNKHHLYILVATYLKNNPTTADTPTLLLPPGYPPPDPQKPTPEPAIPRGWKMGAILPLHSPAMSGGGVSETFLQDMMAQMQGGSGIPPTADSTDTKKKKEKKEKVKKVKG